jgi:ankyrin repeat protein
MDMKDRYNADVKQTFWKFANLMKTSLAFKEALEEGLNPNLRNKEGRTLLHEAVFRGRDEAAMLLLAFGADPDLQDENGRTAAHVAVSQGTQRGRDLLVEHGADFTIKDRWGWSANVPFDDFFERRGNPPHGLHYVPRQKAEPTSPT